MRFCTYILFHFGLFDGQEIKSPGYEVTCVGICNITYCSIAPVNPDWFYLSVAGSPG